MQVIVKPRAGASIELLVQATDTIAQVKGVLVAKVNAPANSQHLVYNETVLENSKTLQDYKIPPLGTLSLFVGTLKLFLERTEAGADLTFVLKANATESFTFKATKGIVARAILDTVSQLTGWPIVLLQEDPEITKLCTAMAKLAADFYHDLEAPAAHSAKAAGPSAAQPSSQMSTKYSSVQGFASMAQTEGQRSQEASIPSSGSGGVTAQLSHGPESTQSAKQSLLMELHGYGETHTQAEPERTTPAPKTMPYKTTAERTAEPHSSQVSKTVQYHATTHTEHTTKVSETVQYHTTTEPEQTTPVPTTEQYHTTEEPRTDPYHTTEVTKTEQEHAAMEQKATEQRKSKERKLEEEKTKVQSQTVVKSESLSPAELRRPNSVQPATSGSWYLYADTGFNLQAICKNPGCEARDKYVVIKMKLGSFLYGELEATGQIVCPACKVHVDPLIYLFWDCHFVIFGVQEDDTRAKKGFETGVQATVKGIFTTFSKGSLPLTGTTSQSEPHKDDHSWLWLRIIALPARDQVLADPTYLSFHQSYS